MESCLGASVVRNTSGSKRHDITTKPVSPGCSSKKISSTGSPFFIEYFTKKSRCSQ